MKVDDHTHTKDSGWILCQVLELMVAVWVFCWDTMQSHFREKVLGQVKLLQLSGNEQQWADGPPLRTCWLRGYKALAFKRCRKTDVWKTGKASSKECFVRGKEDTVIVRAAAVRWDGSLQAAKLPLSGRTPFPGGKLDLLLPLPWAGSHPSEYGTLRV